jgi:uncharacterized membrane protein (UPF0136 family)
MPKLIKASKPTAALPEGKKQLLLPEPKQHLWIFLAIIWVPLGVVIFYALNSQFSISAGAVHGIVFFIMLTFLAALMALVIAFVKFFIDFWKARIDSARRDKNIIILTLLYLLSLLMFASVFQALAT